MSDYFYNKGIDSKYIRWWNLASCNNMNVNWFFDDYESDQVLAKQIDNVCISCPVIKFCYKEGIENKLQGVWGGVYVKYGKPKKQYNMHKTPEVWRKLKKLHG